MVQDEQQPSVRSERPICFGERRVHVFDVLNGQHYRRCVEGPVLCEGESVGRCCVEFDLRGSLAGALDKLL